MLIVLFAPWRASRPPWRAHAHGLERSFEDGNYTVEDGGSENTYNIFFSDRIGYHEKYGMTAYSKDPPRPGHYMKWKMPPGASSQSQGIRALAMEIEVTDARCTVGWPQVDCVRANVVSVLVGSSEDAAQWKAPGVP